MIVVEESFLRSENWIYGNRRILTGRRRMTSEKTSWIIPLADVQVANRSPCTGVQVTFEQIGSNIKMHLFKVTSDGQFQSTHLMKIDDSFKLIEEEDEMLIEGKGYPNQPIKVVVRPSEAMDKYRVAAIVGEIKQYQETAQDRSRMHKSISSNAENIITIAGHLQDFNTKFATAPSPLPDDKLAELVRNTQKVLENMKEPPSQANTAVPERRTRKTAVARSLTSSFDAVNDITTASTSGKKRGNQSESADTDETGINKKKK